MENEELGLTIAKEENAVMDLTNFRKNSKVQVGTFTNITDSVELFNIQSHVDYMLNDCVGEKIRFVKVLIRRFEKPLDNPIVDEVTGEILKETELKFSCVLIDAGGKSYATGSKTFTFNLMNYLSDFGGATKLDEGGIEIEVIKVPTPSGNKALSFKLLR